MTLVELALTLAVIVFGGVYLIWRTGVEYRRNIRGFWVHRESDLRRAEDQAWAANRLADYALAQTITLQRYGCETVDALVAVLARAERDLEVVA